MDDVTKKVLAETWGSGVLTSGLAGIDVGDSCAGVFGSLLVESSHRVDIKGSATAHDITRARIAACAPEALRLLLEAEWAGGEPVAQYEHGVSDVCPWCQQLAVVRNPKHVYRGDEPWETEGSHAPDCRWLALMVKAGLR